MAGLNGFRKIGAWIAGTNAEEPGYDEDDDFLDEFEDEEEPEEESAGLSSYKNKNKKSKPISRYSADTYARVESIPITRANFFYPEKLDDCKHFIELLRDKQMVTICFRHIGNGGHGNPNEVKQRIIDVITGACVFSESSLQMFGDCDTLIVAPKGFKLNGDFDKMGEPKAARRPSFRPEQRMY